jgi:hypothetical protein
MGRRNFIVIDVDEFQMFEKDAGFAMFRGLAKNSARQGWTGKRKVFGSE